jgi:hypothetical protein
MGVGLDRTEIVQQHDLDVLCDRLDDGAQDVCGRCAQPLIATRTAIFLR